MAGRKTAPTAAIIDSQSVKAAEEIARTSRRYDAGKKINGRKRHIAVDTIGLLLTVLITAASVQDRDAAKPLLWNLSKAFPKVRLAWADGGYARKLVTWSKTALKLTLQIVKRPDDLHTFKVLPRRWVVERTLAWITRHRRTVRGAFGSIRASAARTARSGQDRRGLGLFRRRTATSCRSASISASFDADDRANRASQDRT